MAGVRRKLRIGARGSVLSRIQARTVGSRLEMMGFAVEYRWITTAGDRDRSLRFSGVGMFVREIQQALLRGTVDVAVHSAKDLPTRPVDGVSTVAMLARDIPWDLLIYRQPLRTVGTSSTRRQALLSRMFPEVRVVGLRGNVDTRLRKLVSGEVDGVVLSAAGLVRMGRWAPGQSTLEGLAVRLLLPPDAVPAPAQGIVAVQMREDDPDRESVRRVLHHDPTGQAADLERSLLALAEAGCHAPFGAFVRPPLSMGPGWGIETFPDSWVGYLFYALPQGVLEWRGHAPTREVLSRTMEQVLQQALTGGNPP